MNHIRSSGSFVIDRVKNGISIGGRSLSAEALEFQSESAERDRATIRMMADLKGKLSLANPEAALEFARLRTSPATFNLFSASGFLMVEVTTEEAWTASNSYGLPSWMFKNEARATPKITWCERGIIPPEIWSESGIPEASVEAGPRGFLVRRTVVILDAREALRSNRWNALALFMAQSAEKRTTVCDIVEEISHNADYRIIGKQNRVLSGIRWSFESLAHRRWSEWGLVDK